MRRAKQRVRLLQFSPDFVGGEIAGENDARLAREQPPVVAPAVAPDDLERRIGKAVASQLADDARGVAVVFARLDGADAEQTKRRLRLTRRPFGRADAEDVPDFRPVDEDLRIAAAEAFQLSQRIERVYQKTRIAADRQRKRL